MGVGALVDTGFLISLAREDRDNHDAAVAYWRYLRENNILIFLSVIVVSEFEVKQPIDDRIRRACIPLLFNWNDATCAAEFDRIREKESGAERQAVKDDIKIIAQAVQADVAYVITDDHNTFAKYAERLREKGLVRFSTIVLRDGFDAGHFRDGGRDLLTPQGI